MPNVPWATFIPGTTSFPESRVHKYIYSGKIYLRYSGLSFTIMWHIYRVINKLIVSENLLITLYGFLNSLQNNGIHWTSSPNIQVQIYIFLNSLQNSGKLWTRSDLSILPECSNLVIDIHMNFYKSRFFLLLSLKICWKPKISTIKTNISLIFFECGSI